MFRVVNLLAGVAGLAGAISDSEFDIRVPDGPQVEVVDAGIKVTFAGLMYNTSIYGDDGGLDNDGTSVEAFLGIPYAESPTDELRFRQVALKPVYSLRTDFDATVWRPGCMQEPGMFTQDTSDFSEDCLYLNIWRQKGTKAGDKKPVIFIIHGGGYTAGDAHEFDWRGPQMAHFGDLVVVNANYRLGVFGFLDLGLADANGHQGHLDQGRALQWIERYISAFGGDPSRVTLFGVSAGSFSISWHLLSGLTKGLFHAAVMDAGVLTYTQAEPVANHIKRAARIASNYTCFSRSHADTTQGSGGGYTTEERRQILKCLHSIPATRLVDLQEDFGPSQTYTFRPTYVNDKFLRATPDCITNSDSFKTTVPIIIGDTTNEGMFLLTRRTHDPKPVFSSFDEVVRWTLMILDGHLATSAIETGENATLLKKFYGAEDKWADDLVEAGAQIIGDGLFVCPVMNFANHYAQVEPRTYFFRWSRIRVTETFPGEHDEGAYHGLMFYTGAGGQYLYLKGQMSDMDKAYIINTIRMIRDFSVDPQRTPKFNDTELVSHSDGLVNDFSNEKCGSLRIHPKVATCEAVWGAFAEKKC